WDARVLVTRPLVTRPFMTWALMTWALMTWALIVRCFVAWSLMTWVLIFRPLRVRPFVTAAVLPRRVGLGDLLRRVDPAVMPRRRVVLQRRKGLLAWRGSGCGLGRRLFRRCGYLFRR